MIRTRWGCTLALVVLASSCGGGDQTALDDLQSADGGGEQVVDSGNADALPLPAGDEGHPGVGAVLSPGQVRAGQTTDTAQLLSGIKVEGRVGDFKIYNDRVAFIIAQRRQTNGYNPFGGELLDAQHLALGQEGHSLLGETFFGAGTAVVDPISVGVIADGSDGQPAVIRVIGDLAPIPALDAAAMGLSFNLPFHCVIDYKLAADSDALEISWRLLNKTATDRGLSLTALGLIGGDGARFFAEGVGFQVDQARAAQQWFGQVGETLSYTLVSLDASMVPLLVYEGLWIVYTGRVTVPAEGQIEHRYLLGLTDGSPEAVHRQIRNLTDQPEPPTVTGLVTEPGGQPVAGARVHVQRASDAAYLTMARTDATGRYEMALDPGSYLFRVAAAGRDLTDALQVSVGAQGLEQDLAVGDTASLRFTVVDGAGDPLPAKLIIARNGGAKPAPASFGEERLPGGASAIIFHPGGAGEVALPPGDYSVTVSRGFEYELDTATVTLQADAETSLSFELIRSVDTSGWVCGDFHMHAMWSPDSSDRYEHKVRAAAAEGVELPVATDHDYIADYNPAIARLSLQKWLQGVVGEELSTLVYGHFNPYPIVAAPDQRNAGAMEWIDLSPPQLFAAVRQRWPEAVLQVNHPRSSRSGYFEYVGYDPATGRAERQAELSTDLDAMEVFNDSGWRANRDRSVRDWFSLLDRGLRVTAVGNSDSHDALSTEVGYPRNYVRLSTDEPAAVDLAEFAQSIKRQQVVVSGGPFIRARIGEQTVGGLADASSGQVALQIEVQAPTWVPAETLRVFVGGVDRGEERVTVTLDETTADPTNPVIRFDDTVTIDVARDSWVVVVVEASGTLAPVVRDEQPFAVTNPIYLDVDGNGRYDPPLTF